MSEIKILHPSGGHVIFTEPTIRQKQILDYHVNLVRANSELKKNIKYYPNDKELGETIRKDFISWEV
jgi:hypothetical protein